MIDRILRRYISKEAELVLTAMEKIGGDPEKMSEYYLEREYNQMYDDVIEFEGFISRWALARTFARLQATMRRETKRARAAKSAAQILMGVDFKPQPENGGHVISGSGSGGSVQQMRATFSPSLQQQMQQMQMQGLVNSQMVNSLRASHSYAHPYNTQGPKGK